MALRVYTTECVNGHVTSGGASLTWTCPECGTTEGKITNVVRVSDQVYDPASEYEGREGSADWYTDC